MHSFEDMIVWQKSREFVKEIYKTFQTCKDYSFRDQIQRAAISVMNNLAEGFERKGDKEMARFWTISLSSCAEVRSMLYAGEDLKYVSTAKANELRLLGMLIRKMTLALIRSVR